VKGAAVKAAKEMTTKQIKDFLHKESYNNFKEFFPIWEMKCWKGYRKVGMKKKGNHMVNDCRPVKKKVTESTESVYHVKAKVSPQFSSRMGNYVEGNIRATSPVNALAKLLSIHARKYGLGNFIGLIINYAKQNSPTPQPVSPGQMTLTFK